MPDVQKRFANNSDDWRISDVQLLGRASVKREFRSRPTDNRFADRTPLLLRRYFTDNDARFVAGRILKRKV